ncbi:MAG: flagellar biosynthetic protein FliO [bacterium]
MKRRSTLWASAVIVGLAVTGLILLNVNQSAAVNETAAAALGQAAQPETQMTAIDEFGDSGLAAIGKMTAALVVVIFAIYGGVWLLRRLSGGRGSRKEQRLLEVLETAYLGPKKSVTLLRVADKSVLLGVTETGMSVLTELDADQTTVALAGPEQVTSGDNFDRLFASASRQLQRFAGRSRPATQVS